MQLEIDESLVFIIQKAAKKAFTQLFQEHNENFYYCSLITTGEGLCPIISAWSEEALDKAVEGLEDIEEAKYDLKWSYAESTYFAYGEEYFQDVKKVFSERMKQCTTDYEKEKEVSL